jgi:threonylcarbamoyladenosine tRNA methylthiotransferase MtaB
MARKTTPETFARLVALARRMIPGVALTTDIIVGFPGESEAEFTASLNFVRWMDFAAGHVFSYSSPNAKPPRFITMELGINIEENKDWFIDKAFV